MKKIYNIIMFVVLSAIATSCSQDLDLSEQQGYLNLRVESRTSTVDVTRASAPDNYNPLVLHVEILDASGTVVKSTDDFNNDASFSGNIMLPVGRYTVVAHSANWDGSGAGFDAPYYYGSAEVTVEAQNLKTATVVCTQANVKLTVNYDANFRNAFRSAVTKVLSSVSGVAQLQFVMGQTTRSGYIPVGDFDIQLSAVNSSSVTNTLSRSFTGVKAREHYILNFKMAEQGNLGDGTSPAISVEVDESTNTYSFTFEVPTKASTTLLARSANAWSTFAMLNASVTAKTSSFSSDGLEIQWRRRGESAWNTIAHTGLTVDASDNVSATLQGLTPNTSYEYRLRYVENDNEVLSDAVSFTTEGQTELYNGGFEYWHQSGAPWYPNEEGVTYWDTSNPGSTVISASYNVTTATTTTVHGGSKAAQLASTKVLIKFAAGSIYTGTFGATIGTSGAWLTWGTPFTSRPTNLHGFYQYAPVAVNNVSSNVPAGAPAKGEMDQCAIYWALLTEQIVVNNTDMSTFPDFETDSRIVAYGTLPLSQCGSTNGNWVEFNIPLTYYSTTIKPSYLLVVASSSRYGDYFHGGAGSTLYLDDFSLEYGDNPTVR